MIRSLPKNLRHLLLFLVVLALLPPSVIAYMRTFPSDKPPIHLIQDMDNQARFRAQQANPFFTDNRSMRQPVPGTIARGDPQADSPYETGRESDAWTARFPPSIPVSLEFVQRGRKRYRIYCLPCHGPAGQGNGIVDASAKRLLINTRRGFGTSWVPPANLHQETVAKQPVGQIFNTITHGLNSMPAYGPQIPVRDRWAITAYVKALQRSRNAQPADLPSGLRDSLPEVRKEPTAKNETAKNEDE